MTRETWETCSDLGQLLGHLGARSSPRTFRLFAIACCARLGPLLDADCLKALACAERWVDDPLRGRKPLYDAGGLVDPVAGVISAAARVVRRVVNLRCAGSDLWMLSRRVREVARLAVSTLLESGSGTERAQAEEQIQARLLRDLLGNPFVAIDLNPAWTAWNRGLLRKMAQVIYQEKRFEDMPILADALEEAGCNEPALLDHCRSSGEHVRGCWLLDRLLGI